MREREGEWEWVERETVHEREGEWERVERETGINTCYSCLNTSSLFIPEQSRLNLMLSSLDNPIISCPVLFCNTYRELHEDPHFAAPSYL